MPVVLTLGALLALGTHLSPVRADDPPEKTQCYIGAMDADGRHIEIFKEAVLPGMANSVLPQWSPSGDAMLFDAKPERDDAMNAHAAVYYFEGPKKGKTEDLGLTNGPVWSGDGKQIAFLLNNGSNADRAGIWTMNVDGTDRKWRCEGGFPLWSPDGKTIAYTGTFRTPYELMLYDVPSGKSRVFAQGKLKIRWFPSWSADSKKLAAIGTWDDARMIVIYDVEREELDQMLWATEATGGLPKGTFPRNVIWSPKGDQILVNFQLDAGPCQWWKIGMGKLEQVMFDKSKPIPLLVDPCWSPDGKRIGFCTMAASGEA